MMEFPPQGDGRATQGNSLKETQWLVGPELRLLNLHFFNICRHHPTLKFKPHATDDERYVSGVDGVPLIQVDSYIFYFGIYMRWGFNPCWYMTQHQDQ